MRRVGGNWKSTEQDARDRGGEKLRFDPCREGRKNKDAKRLEEKADAGEDPSKRMGDGFRLLPITFHA